jgi:nucleotide-binding universal stress UspA family protein
MDDHSTGSLPFRRILHLTDFSACSDAALKWAMDMARTNEAKLAVLHVVIPDALTYMTPDSPDAALDLQEQWARREMQRIDAQLDGMAHDTMVPRGTEVWSVVESKLKELRSDLIVLGTHRRTGLRKLLIGSVAEKILRISAVPVMTIGLGVARGPKGDGTFHRVLLATNFTAGSAEAAAYARALAKRAQTELVLVHACEKTWQTRSNKRSELSIAEVMHRLYEAIPGADTLPCRPEAVVEFGEAGAQILEVAKRKEADLIVMGIRDAGSVFAATHLEVGTAHNVVAQAPCPVLTVRPKIRQAA